MMTKLYLPKLWLYITFAIIILSFTLVSCSQDSNEKVYNDDTTNKHEETEYTVTFMPDSNTEGESQTLTVKNGELLVLEGPKFERIGFTLIGWQSAQTGADDYFPLGTELIVNSSVTLLPVWQISTYEVIFSPGANGVGTSIMAIKTHAQPLAFANNTFTREGYTQIGWSIVDGGEQVFGLVGEYVDDRAMIFYPVWQKNTYTVTVNPGKDSSGDTLSTTVLYEGKYKAPDKIYSRADYDLIGWATEDGGALKYQLGEEIAVKGNLSLYPVWELTKTFDITPDYKKLPRTLMTTMSVADLALYYKLVNAFLSYENSVSFTSDTRPDLVLEILQCYFPVMYADMNENGPWINYTDSTINFSYVTTGIDEHNERIAHFTEVVSSLLADFNRTDTDVERALLIYQRLLRLVRYDEKADLYPDMQTAFQSSAYYAIMFELGRSDALSSAYAFLLTQADVDAVLVNSEIDSGMDYHYWVAIMLDFKWYYADITLDLKERGFTHFGLSDSEMIALGYKDAQNNAISAYTGNSIKELVDTLDTRFHVFHGGAYSPVLDRDNDRVVFKDKDGIEAVFNIIENIG